MSVISKLIFIVSICAINCIAYAASKGSSQTVITSDKLIVEELKNTATFSNHVVYKNDDTTLRSELMIVFYEPKEGDAGSPRAVKRIEVYGNVEIITPKERATGKKGVYEADQDVFYLLEEVKMYSDKSELSGEKFIYNKKTGKSLLLGKKDSKTGKPIKPKLILEQE